MLVLLDVLNELDIKRSTNLPEIASLRRISCALWNELRVSSYVFYFCSPWIVSLVSDLLSVPEWLELVDKSEIIGGVEASYLAEIALSGVSSLIERTAVLVQRYHFVNAGVSSNERRSVLYLQDNWWYVAPDDVPDCGRVGGPA